MQLTRCVSREIWRQIVIFLKLRMVNIWRVRIGSIFRSDLESLSGTGRCAQFSPLFTSFHHSVTNQPNRRIHVEEGMEDFYRLNLTWNEFLRPSRFLLLESLFLFFFFICLFLPRNEAFNVALTRFLVFFPAHTVSSARRRKNPWTLEFWKISFNYKRFEIGICKSREYPSCSNNNSFLINYYFYQLSLNLRDQNYRNPRIKIRFILQNNRNQYFILDTSYVLLFSLIYLSFS